MSKTSKNKKISGRMDVCYFILKYSPIVFKELEHYVDYTTLAGSMESRIMLFNYQNLFFFSR